MGTVELDDLLIMYLGMIVLVGTDSTVVLYCWLKNELWVCARICDLLVVKMRIVRKWFGLVANDQPRHNEYGKFQTFLEQKLLSSLFLWFSFLVHPSRYVRRKQQRHRHRKPPGCMFYTG